MYTGGYSSITPEKHYVYDKATVTNNTMAFVKGRLAEAYTGPINGKITDLGFSYTKRGEVSDVWQSSPNSGGYYPRTKGRQGHDLLDH